MRLSLGLLAAVVPLLGGCTLAAEGTALAGQRCSEEWDCAEALICVATTSNRTVWDSGFCSPRCEQDADCEGIDPETRYACGRTSVGAVCLPDACGGESHEGVYCDEGAPVTCRAEPHCSRCFRCGLLDEHEWCDLESGECRPKVELGRACTWDYECRNGNCNPVEGVCFADVGSPCSDLCDRCVGGRFCSRDCADGGECNGHWCVDGFCEPACEDASDPSCGGTCLPVEEGSDLRYCACEGDCVTLTTRGPGAPCTNDARCESGRCVDRDHLGRGVCE